MKSMMSGVRLSVLAATVLAAAGCSGHARTVLDEIRGADPAGLAGLLAGEGYSVGALRTAELPGGVRVVAVTPEPSDGYTPQVTVFRLDNDRPVFETEAVCDPFQWTTQISGDVFYGLDPAPITSMAWEAWDGGERRDLVVDISMTARNDGYGGTAAKAEMRARCAFRSVDEPEVGGAMVAVFGWIEHATMESDYGEMRTEILEEHSMRPVEGEPDQFDFQVLTKTVTCNPDESGHRLCIPETNVNIRRYALAGEGIDAVYAPLGELGYMYRYGPPPYQPLGVYGTPGGTYGDDSTGTYTVPDYGGYTAPDYSGYSDTGIGVYGDDSTGTDYGDEPSGGDYGDESTGEDCGDESAGQPPCPSEEEGAGSDE
ncbi:MAG: hypothetical protein HY905_20660 [Deltaproteobacteria bacterium]|nr:hypothetical protein [Deltaproteobacteria bacterium]